MKTFLSVIFLFLTLHLNASDSKGVKIANDLKESVVKILYYQNGQIVRSGTGVVVDNHGTVLTTAHLIYDFPNEPIDPDSIAVVFVNDTINSKIFQIDIVGDWMFLETNYKKAKPVKLSSQKPLIGEDVFVYSSPGKLPPVLDKGMLSAREKKISGISYYNYFIGKRVEWYGFSGFTSSGSSGGALLNTKGELLGLIVAKPYTTGGNAFDPYGFAIPVEDIPVKKVTDSIAKLYSNPPNQAALPPIVINNSGDEAYSLEQCLHYSYIRNNIRYYPQYNRELKLNNSSTNVIYPCIKCHETDSYYYYFKAYHSFKNGNSNNDFQHNILTSIVRSNADDSLVIEKINLGIIGATAFNMNGFKLLLNKILAEKVESYTGDNKIIADSMSLSAAYYSLGMSFLNLNMEKEAMECWQKSLGYDVTYYHQYLMLTLLTQHSIFRLSDIDKSLKDEFFNHIIEKLKSEGLLDNEMSENIFYSNLLTIAQKRFEERANYNLLTHSIIGNNINIRVNQNK